ncbi:heavy metal-associated isoprenylated plant protein 47-like [Nymphaea colorata]|nr:heavy metal-associated isoprenylated plant protein 47-like [Nymphaea colorata]
MKKKVVLRVQMCCDRCRTKSLETVASIYGVLSVALEGAERNLVVVVGEDIDPVTITEKLRKKAGQTELVKVEGIVSVGEETDDDGDDQHQWPAVRNGYPNYIAPVQICEGDHPTTGCSIM